MTTNTNPDPIRSRRLVVSPDGEGGFLAVDMSSGDITWHSTPAAVVAGVKKQDRAAARKGTSSVTQLDWQDMPDGFAPPQPR